jgi:hypothetical protein
MFQLCMRRIPTQNDPLDNFPQMRSVGALLLSLRLPITPRMQILLAGLDGRRLVINDLERKRRWEGCTLRESTRRTPDAGPSYQQPQKMITLYGPVLRRGWSSLTVTLNVKYSPRHRNAHNRNPDPRMIPAAESRSSVVHCAYRRTPF